MYAHLHRTEKLEKEARDFMEASSALAAQLFSAAVRGVKDYESMWSSHHAAGGDDDLFLSDVVSPSAAPGPSSGPPPLEAMVRLRERDNAESLTGELAPPAPIAMSSPTRIPISARDASIAPVAAAPLLASSVVFRKDFPKLSRMLDRQQERRMHPAEVSTVPVPDAQVRRSISMNMRAVLERDMEDSKISDSPRREAAAAAPASHFRDHVTAFPSNIHDLHSQSSSSSSSSDRLLFPTLTAKVRILQRFYRRVIRPAAQQKRSACAILIQAVWKSHQIRKWFQPLLQQHRRIIAAERMHRRSIQKTALRVLRRYASWKRGWRHSLRDWQIDVGISSPLHGHLGNEFERDKLVSEIGKFEMAKEYERWRMMSVAFLKILLHAVQLDHVRRDIASMFPPAAAADDDVEPSHGIE